jgi:hypothetical protein
LNWISNFEKKSQNPTNHTDPSTINLNAQCWATTNGKYCSTSSSLSIERTSMHIMPRLLSSCLVILSLLVHQSLGFTALKPSVAQKATPSSVSLPPQHIATTSQSSSSSSSRFTALSATPPDLDIVALVAGQENYGLAIVAVGEGIYSFLQAPTLDNIFVVIPPVIAAIVLVAVSGPMITSGVAASVATGLLVATAVSLALGASYVVRLTAGGAASATAPKEIAFLGLLVAVAGFFSFAQNLVVDGFVTLPALPTITLPSLPSQPTIDFI